jgi:hypothetical protein
MVCARAQAEAVAAFNKRVDAQQGPGAAAGKYRPLR